MKNKEWIEKEWIELSFPRGTFIGTETSVSDTRNNSGTTTIDEIEVSQRKGYAYGYILSKEVGPIVAANEYGDYYSIKIFRDLYEWPEEQSEGLSSEQEALLGEILIQGQVLRDLKKRNRS